LPQRYGLYLDERVVEYPWLLSRLPPGAARLLDAGSTLNFDAILRHPVFADKDVSIVTLDPEPNCYWDRRISYLFDDLRLLPFRDELFDIVISISTLEHVGMDNSFYSAGARAASGACDDYEVAVREMHRITRPHGRVYITVPFGKYRHHGWFQQFDGTLVDRMISAFQPAQITQTYFRYTDEGWNIADRADCSDCQYFDIHQTKLARFRAKGYDQDFAAASRAIAAIELQK